jgi:hypothetical protein
MQELLPYHLYWSILLNYPPGYFAIAYSYLVNNNRDDNNRDTDSNTDNNYDSEYNSDDEKKSDNGKYHDDLHNDDLQDNDKTKNEKTTITIPTVRNILPRNKGQSCLEVVVISSCKHYASI